MNPGIQKIQGFFKHSGIVKNSLYIYKFKDSRVQEFKNLTIQEFEFKIEKSKEAENRKIQKYKQKIQKCTYLRIWKSKNKIQILFSLFSKKLEKNLNIKNPKIKKSWKFQKFDVWNRSRFIILAIFHPILSYIHFRLDTYFVYLIKFVYILTSRV